MLLPLVTCRNAYNMVLHKFGDKLYNGVANALRSHLVGVASRIEAAQGLPFLKELKSCWDDHNKSTQMIRDILMVRSVAVCAHGVHVGCVVRRGRLLQLVCRGDGKNSNTQKMQASRRQLDARGES
jgi:hypothetical protein